MGVMMQCFYWDCPEEGSKEFKWWNFVRARVAELSAVGFTSLWLPPVHKAANLDGFSMGYDPYDYYDLGEYDQKGAVPTWFGTKQELLTLIHNAHKHDLTVLASMVIHHNSGADARERNPLTGQERWTLFQPASGKFPRNWESFHPNLYESWEERASEEMPRLSHHNPRVFGELLELARWMIEEIGFDGFCYDFAHGVGENTIAAMQEYHYRRQGRAVIPHGVASLGVPDRSSTGGQPGRMDLSAANPVSAFDVSLREILKALCDQYGFSLKNLAAWNMGMRQGQAGMVTFVENHELRLDGRPITNDKLLAYSFILTHEGHPCVFWKDYYNYALGMADTPHGIAALVRAHQDFAGGGTDTLYVDDDLYIMQRTGHDQAPGLVYVLNNRGLGWNGEWVNTCWQNATFTPVAWWSRTDLHRPGDQPTDPSGRGQFYAPPRGYVVYAPRT